MPSTPSWMTGLAPHATVAPPPGIIDATYPGWNAASRLAVAALGLEELQRAQHAEPGGLLRLLLLGRLGRADAGRAGGAGAERTAQV